MNEKESATFEGSSAAGPEYTRGYRRFALAMLTILYAFNFIDRQILVILQESIKVDMDLSDTQLGILSGFAFAIFYVSAGIPIARWADSANRRNIITAALAIWSSMTVLSGLVQNYTQMLLARIGVGIGEAGGSPPAHSMISDYFPPEERATAMSIYSMGIYAGILTGLLGGGYVGQTYGWRAGFFVVGIPGVLFALLLRFTVVEPTRGRWDSKAMSTEKPPLRDALGLMWQKRSFRWLALGCGLVAFVGYGTANFMPSFLQRVHNMGVFEASIVLAGIQGIAGAIGTVAGGWITDRLIQRDRRYYAWVPAFATLIALPFSFMAYTATWLPIAIAGMTLYVLFASMFLGPSLAASHTMMPAGVRALVSAILFFVLNLIGLGLGPVFTGFVSDTLSPTMGAVDGLRYAMMATTCVGFTGIVCYLIGARSMRDDLSHM